MLSAMGVTIMMKKHPITRLISTTVLALASFFKAPTKLLRFRFKTQNFFMRFRRSSTLKKTENVDENGDFRKEF